MPPLPQRSEILRQLFQPVGRSRSRSIVVGKGALVSFSYSFWKNDASPLVVVSENDRINGKLWGVNLHYLTFPYIRQLLDRAVNNPAFSYKSIADDDYVKKAYRSYKLQGVSRLRTLDKDFLLRIMGMVRSYDPAEVQIIRRQVQEQIRQQINPKTNQITTLEQPPEGETNIGE